MGIEIQFNSVMVDPQKLQEQFPNLISAIRYYSQTQKPLKRRKRKKKKTVAVLIDEILDEIQIG